ncbi:MAG: glycosyltransferase family 2 protein [Candidatus Bathycorpusculaceae bacterium]
MKDNLLVSVVIPTHDRNEKLVRLIHSVLESNYPQNKIEIIVVDDASTDGTYEKVAKEFPSVKLIRNNKELLIAASRNLGIQNAKNDCIFLIDDDNVVDENCIHELVKVIENDASVGVVAPIMYYLKQPNRVWCAGIRRNMITSLTKFIGKDEIDVGQFSGLIESKDFPNAFMIKREVFEKVGLFNEHDFPIHYEEADFGERVRRAGYRVVCNPTAKVWHDMPVPEEVVEKTRLYHIYNEFRAYYAGRNRIIFHKKYSKWWQFLLFVLFFNLFISLHYVRVILFKSIYPFKDRVKIARQFIRGIAEGLLF